MLFSACAMIGCSTSKKVQVTSKPTVQRKASSGSYNNKVHRYIDTYSDIAMSQMKTHKIPASITLAQGILESGSGESDLAKRSNNHFGIKCHSDWKGKKVYHDDNRKGECFRKYNHPRESFNDHSLFLKKSRYQFLYKYKPHDYKSWAHGLKKAGYATDSRYPQKLIDLIERYDLHKYDQLVLKGKSKAPKQETPKKTKSNSSAKTHTVAKGDTLYSLSRKYGMSVDQIKRLNGLKSNTISIGQKLKVN
ncbi:hemagglutinin [Aureibacter tunicatorum]|nr:hemagglutinin [Aureibacter tunicatorum]